MQNTSPTVVGRRALLKGAAMLAVAATARAQGQPPAAEQPTTLADVPLGPSVTVTVERRGDIVLVGLNRPSNRRAAVRHARLCSGYQWRAMKLRINSAVRRGCSTMSMCAASAICADFASGIQDVVDSAIS